MSHSHSHAPGESHSHSHGPAATGQQPQQQQQPAAFVPPPPDPSILSLIEQDFKAVPLKLGDPNNSNVFCNKHSLPKCDDCGLDFSGLNYFANIFIQNPQIICPPPPTVIQPQRSQAVTKTKEDGNKLFKLQRHKEAISMYTMAASVASQRLLWEPNQLMKEELSTVLSNRSAAYAASGDYISALADADTVIQLKRPWSKGHFRKAKALVGLSQYEEAKKAIQLGLAFEPNNTEMTSFLDEINGKLEKSKKH